jgi:hypothetical protein
MPAPIQENPQVIHVMSVQGMNDKDEPHVLSETFVRFLQNLEIAKAGQRKRRLGVTPIGGRSDAPGGIWNMYDLTVGGPTLFNVYGGKVYNFQGGGLVQERCSGISLTGSIHMGVGGRWNNRLATYVVQNGKNDSSATLTSKLAVMTDDNTWTQVSNVAFRAACWFQNRIWGGPDAYAGQSYDTIWFSALGDGLSYSSLNTLQIEPGVGGDVTGLFPLRGFTPTVVIFKESAIATLEPYWGSTSNLIPVSADALDTIKTNVRLISANVGCPAPGSIQFVPGAPGGDVYYLSGQGVRALTRANDDTVSGSSPPITDAIKGTIDRINWRYAHKCMSAVHDNKYFLGVPLDGATEITHTIVIDLLNGGCSTHTWTPKAFTAVQTPADTSRYLWMQYNQVLPDCSNTAAASAYHTYKCFSGSVDPGSEPVLYVEDSRAIHYGSVDLKKRWDFASLTFRNDAANTCTIGLMYNVDQKGWVTIGSAVFGTIAGGIDPVMGLTPLPWGIALTATRTYRFSLADVEPGYIIQIRYFGVSDWSLPAILDMSVAARPILKEYDNSIT